MQGDGFGERGKPLLAATACVLVAAAAELSLARWLGPAGGLVFYFPAIVAGALLGAWPGALALALSLAIEGLHLGWSSRGFAPDSDAVLRFSIFAACIALTVLIVWRYRRRREPSERADQLFRTVQDISLEGIVVYRALFDRAGQVCDFEYRYANPAARAIMASGGSEAIVGARLLERLPLAREHPLLFPRYVRVFTNGERSETEYELGGRWFHSTAARLSDGLVVTVQDVSARRRGDEARNLLLHELNHRVRNLLASVIAMAHSTERGVASAGEFREKLSERLQALSRAHGLLIAGAWTDAAVGEVVQSTLEPYLESEASRFRIHGPHIKVSADVALALNMALHELATNAVKYGALSGPDGQIEIGWELAAEKPGFVRLAWIETGGPTTSPPQGRGFGTRLLERAFAATDGGVELRFLESGVSCEMFFAAAAERQPAIA